jgi:hypothetical protein
MPIATALSRLQWSQPAPDLAFLATAGAEAYIDDTTIVPLLNVVFTGVASPFVGSSAFPAITPGPHTVRVRVVDTAGLIEASDWSEATEFVMTAKYGTPGKPTIVLG